MFGHKNVVYILALGIAVFIMTEPVSANPDPPPRPNLGPGENNWIPRKASPEVDKVMSLPTVDLCPGTGLTPTMLAEALLGSGPDAPVISNVTFTGACVAAGTFSGGAGILGFDSGIVLSSGNVAYVTGPNMICNTTSVNGQPGDLDLNTLIPGYTTFDAAVLEFDFECPFTQIVSFNYVFTSEEYNEFVGSNYNDVFGFFVNGVNVALLPDNVTAVAINNVNCGYSTCGNPTPGGTNCIYYRNNDCSTGSPCVADTEMDGLTVVFSVTATVQPGLNHIKLAIADAGDSRLDSNVFIQGNSFLCTCPDTEGPEAVILSAMECNSDPSDPTTACSTLEWTEPSDPTKIEDGGVCIAGTGPASSYDVRWSTTPILTDADFDAANQVADEPTPGAPGGMASMQVCGLPEGPVYFAIRSSDGINLSATASTDVTCTLNEAPNCGLAFASIAELWPPNHKMVAVSILGVTDDGPGPLSITITGITQDEPVNGKGDGNTSPDGDGVGSSVAILRAERQGGGDGPGNGRVYEVAFMASDGELSCTGSVKVCVPHDQQGTAADVWSSDGAREGRRSGSVGAPYCVDDGQNYDSTVDTGRHPHAAATPIGVRVRPNPFNPSTTIEYSLKGRSHVSLTIYNALGRVVRTLVAGEQPEGTYGVLWNGRDGNGQLVPSGVYLYRLTAGELEQRGRLLLMK